MDLGLDRVAHALRALGLTRPPFAVVQVVGTNGKGSTSRVLAEIMRAHGLRTGLYTSPHFVSFRERVLVDGRMLTEAAWTRLANEVMAASPPDGLTYFELLTVLAVAAFAAAGCEAVVMEAGLGGRWDATTALEADCTAFSVIGLDHVGVLGDTVQAIARDKAGAMRPGVPAVSGPQPGEALDALRDAAEGAGAPFSLARDVADFAALGTEPAMAGAHQRRTAHRARAAWTVLAGRRGWAVDRAACARAVAAARLPGRYQYVEDGAGGTDLLLDGAHNPQGLDALAQTLAADSQRPTAMIFACMADKPVAAMLHLAGALCDGPVLLPALTGNERALAPARIAEVLGPRSEPLPHLAAALERARGFMPGPVLVCGSLYLLGEYFALRPDLLGIPGPDLDPFAAR